MKFDKKKAMAEIIARHYAEFPKEPTGATGPTTDAGKQRSRINAYKHGLTGQILLVTADEHEAFEKHCQAIVEALAPRRHSRAATRPIHRRRPLAPQPRPRHRIRHLRTRPVAGKV